MLKELPSMLKELPSISNSSNGDLKSFQTILRALSWIWLILSFILLPWNIDTIGQNKKCDVMNCKFKINLIWSNVMQYAISEKAFSF